jgi:hypothetical protein
MLSRKTICVLTALFALFVVNALMLAGFRNSGGAESFVDAMVGAAKGGAPAQRAVKPPMNPKAPVGVGGKGATAEGFATLGWNLADAAPKGGAYEPIGPYDGVREVPANGISAWRDTMPDVPLTGKPDPNDMFLFAKNRVSPLCCDSTFSSSGGCVCTTPGQRQFIASRGGNVSHPLDNL